jgi:hypothetical protein
VSPALSLSWRRAIVMGDGDGGAVVFGAVFQKHYLKVSITPTREYPNQNISNTVILLIATYMECKKIQNIFHFEFDFQNWSHFRLFVVIVEVFVVVVPRCLTWPDKDGQRGQNSLHLE